MRIPNKEIENALIKINEKESDQKLVLIRGLPGSGKMKFAK